MSIRFIKVDVLKVKNVLPLHLRELFKFGFAEMKKNKEPTLNEVRKSHGKGQRRGLHLVF